MSNFEHMNDDDILNKLLNAEIPSKTVKVARLGIPVTLHGLTSKEILNAKERHTKIGKKGNITIDEENYKLALIVEATEKPNFGDPKLLSKYSASNAEEVIKRLFLAGELTALGDLVIDLSGFATDLEEIKNA